MFYSVPATQLHCTSFAQARLANRSVHYRTHQPGSWYSLAHLLRYMDGSKCSWCNYSSHQPRRIYRHGCLKCARFQWVSRRSLRDGRRWPASGSRPRYRAQRQAMGRDRTVSDRTTGMFENPRSAGGDRGRE